MKLPAPVPWWKLVVHRQQTPAIEGVPTGKCGWFALDLQVTLEAEAVTCDYCADCMADEVDEELGLLGRPDGWED